MLYTFYLSNINLKICFYSILSFVAMGWKVLLRNKIIKWKFKLIIIKSMFFLVRNIMLTFK